MELYTGKQTYITNMTMLGKVYACAGMIMFSKCTCEHMIMYQHVTTLVTCMYVSMQICADM